MRAIGTTGVHSRWSDIGVVTYEPLGNGMLASAISSPDDFVRVVGEDYMEWGFWKRLFSPGKFERSQTGRPGHLGRPATDITNTATL